MTPARAAPYHPAQERGTVFPLAAVPGEREMRLLASYMIVGVMVFATVVLSAMMLVA